MEKVIALDLEPVLNDGFNYWNCSVYVRPDGVVCSALEHLNSRKWVSSALEIKWNSAERFFSVDFKGLNEHNIDLPLGEALSKRVPLEIARSSRCECGAVLELGDYTIILEGSDFRFRAVYFCGNCKEQLIAEKKGFREIIQRWFVGLKKIEVKATGVGLERE